MDNHTLEEEIYYKTYQTENSEIAFPYKVEPGKVFLLGDFRPEAIDSRQIGTIPIAQLDGKIINLIRNRNL